MDIRRNSYAPNESLVVTYLTRQRENFLSLMQSYDKALALEQSALNSNGQAMQKYQVYQDSIAAKQERINALAQTWVQNMDFESAISGVLDIGEALMKVFSNEQVVAITKSVAAVLVFGKAISSVSLIVKKFAEVSGPSVGTFSKLITSITGVGIGKLIPVIAAATIAITALIAIINKYHKSTEELSQELEGLSSEIDESKNKAETYGEEIDENNKKIAALKKLIDSGIGGVAEQEEIDKLKKENKLLAAQIKLEEERLEIIEKRRQATAKELYGKGFSVSSYTVTESRATKGGGQRGRGTVTPGKVTTQSGWASAENVIAHYEQQIKNLEEAFEEAVDAGDTALADKIMDALLDARDELANEVIPQLEQLRDFFPEIADALDAYYDRMGDIEVATEGVVSATKKIALETPVKQLENLKDKVSAVVAAEEELNETGYVSADVAEDLAEAFGDDVYSAMTWTENGYKISRAALEDLIKAQRVEYELALSEAQNAANKIVNANFDEADSYNAKTQAILNAIKAKKEDIYTSILAGERGFEGWDQMALLRMLQDVEDEVSTLQANLDNFDKTVSYLRRTTTTTKTTSTTKNEETAYEKTIRNLEHQIYLSQQLSDAYKDTDATKYQQEIEKQTELYTQMMDKVHEEAERLRKLGYAETSEEIEDLQQAWWGYYNSRSEMQKSLADDESEYDRTIRNLEHQLYLSEQMANIYEDTDADKYREEIEKQAEFYKQLMNEVHAHAQKLRAQGCAETSEEIQALQKAWWGYYNSLLEMQASFAEWEKGDEDEETAYERAIRILEHKAYLSEQMADVYKGTDEEKYKQEVENQVDYYTQLMDEVQAEAIRLRKEGYDATSEEIQDLERAWWGYYNSRRDLQEGLSDWEKQNAEDTAQAVEDALSEVKDAINDLFDEAEDELNDRLEELDVKIKKNEAIKTLHETFFGILNDVADGMHEISKELDASMRSADYLDESLRKTMFNESDYAELSDKLNKIAADSEKLFKNYLEELESLSEDEIYKAEYITSEFERQYNYKALEYDVAEKELALVKAQTKLQNTLMNRNVRMYKNGQWIWTADYSAVEEAEQEKRDAEYEHKEAEIKLKQQEVIYKYDEIIDTLEKQKESMRVQFNSLKSLWEDVQKQLTTEEDAMTRLLKAINGTDIPEFRKILSDASGSLDIIISGVSDFDGSLSDVIASIDRSSDEIADTIGDSVVFINNTMDNFADGANSAVKKLTDGVDEAMALMKKGIAEAVAAIIASIQDLTYYEEDDGITRWQSDTGKTHSAGYGISDNFALSDGFTASSEDGVTYTIYDKNQNYVATVNTKTGAVSWGGYSDITGYKEAVEELLAEVKSSSSSSLNKTASSGSSSSSSGWTLADGSAANLNYKDTAAIVTGTTSAIKGADLSRDTKWSGQTVEKNGYAITYDSNGYAVKSINVRAGSAREDLANVYPHVDADGNLMYKAGVTDNPATGRDYIYGTGSSSSSSSSSSSKSSSSSSSSSSSKSSSSGSSSSSSVTSQSTSDTKKANDRKFLENLASGKDQYGNKVSAGMSTWAKNELTTNKDKYYDKGGILEGMGGIKATDKDETVFGPELSSKILSPQKSKEFLNSANALTKMLDNSSAFSSVLNRFAGIVGGNGAVSNDSHDVYLNGNPLNNMTKSDSLALTTILRRYIPITGGGR